MFLACFQSVELVKPGDKPTPTVSFTEIVKGIQGKYFHVELVFIKDYVAESLILSSRCEDGWPCLVKKREFNKYKTPYNIYWYKFLGITTEQEIEVKRTVERLIAARGHRMNMYSMIFGSLPSFVSSFRDIFLEVYYRSNGLKLKGPKEFAGNADIPFKHTFCSEFIATVLNESQTFKDSVDAGYNIQDLVVDLLRKGKIEKVNSSDIKLLDHDVAFVLTGVDDRVAASTDLECTDNKIVRSDDYF